MFIFLLQEEHLELIWSQTQKPDTHEAVKQNIFNMLADLAWCDPLP